VTTYGDLRGALCASLVAEGLSQPKDHDMSEFSDAFKERSQFMPIAFIRKYRDDAKHRLHEAEREAIVLRDERIPLLRLHYSELDDIVDELERREKEEANTLNLADDSPGAEARAAMPPLPSGPHGHTPIA
jgi:hypothetical protein